jgi:hypothetical protein
LHHIARVEEGAFGQFRNVNQSFQLLFKLDKGTKIDHVANNAGHNLARLVACFHILPGVAVQPFATQGNAALLQDERLAPLL